MKKLQFLRTGECIHCPTKAEFEAILELVRTEFYNGNPPVKFKNIMPEFWHHHGVNTAFSLFFNDVLHVYRIGLKVYPASEFLPKEFYERLYDKEKESVNPIDHVTLERLSNVLKLLGIELPNETLDTIIDAVELIEQKAGEVTLNDIEKLREEIEAYEANWDSRKVADGKGTLFGDFIFRHYNPKKDIRFEVGCIQSPHPFKPETIREELNKAANADKHHNED